MIIQEELIYKLNYNEKTGSFTWKNPLSDALKPGAKAGHIKKTPSNRYLTIKIGTKAYYAHRLAWLYTYGVWPIHYIDHINGDGLDNRISNLRDVPKAKNSRNRAIQCNSSSGITGVNYKKEKNKWFARIGINGRSLHLGYFDLMEDAIKARKEAEKQHGYHENHGRVNIN